jgi:lipopolysaccharide heptosyltransferase II
LLSGAIITEGPGRWRMAITAPVDTTVSRDPAVLTAMVNQDLEKLIRQSPQDWFWVHNRWKTPSPNFLLSEYKRGVVLPPGFEEGRLKPFRILVRSSNWLGDAVMTTPAVQAIKRGRPDARVTVLVRAKLAEYWKRVAEVDEVIEIEANDTVFSVARKLRGKFDAAVVLPNSIRTGLEVWLAGIPRRVGYPAKGRSWLLNQPILPPRKKTKVAKPQPAQHQVHHYLEIARRLGASLDGLEGAAPEQFFATPALQSFPRPQPQGAPIKIGLCPGAEYGPAKRWLPERFAEVARSVAGQRDCEWVLFGVGGDAAVGAEILAKVEGTGTKVTNLIGKTTLGELMDRLAECRLLLSNDTGTMHLAAALGVPTISVFGSTEPRLTGPLGPGHRILRHQVECSPCFQRECPIDFRCMKSIEPEEVVKAILDALPC